MTFQSIQAFSKHAAVKYLQSAVFIDDNIYNQDTAAPATPQEIATPQRKRAFKPIPGEPSSEGAAEVEPVAEVPQFRTKDLVNSFAKYGIVCAPYEPPTDFETGPDSEVFQLCEAADLVILDWNFNEQGFAVGTKPKELIASLISDGIAVAPHQVRLIVIYTTAPLLEAVANAVFQDLSSPGITVSWASENRLSLQAGSSRVVVLGKPNTARAGSELPSTVDEKDLADRVITEFSTMTQGILPSCALLGMAAIRRNSRRILDKFRNEMDGAFLLHRALVLESEEAFEQLPELFADEFRAVVEDEVVFPDDVTAFIAAVIGELPLGQPPSPWTTSGQQVDAVPIFQKYLSSGKEGLDAHQQCNEASKLKKHDFSKPDLLNSLKGMVSPDSGKGNDLLAALFNTRTQYSQSKRPLTLGTIIREVLPEDKEVFSICLMPVCDSMRLADGSPVSFPFWQLSPLANSKGHGIVVQLEDATYTSLMRKGKPREMFWLEKFTPTPGTGIVTAQPDGDGKFTLTAGQRTFQWVAQLKPAHAQRIAHEVAQSLSRVGLTEAEWVRLMCDR